MNPKFLKLLKNKYYIIYIFLFFRIRQKLLIVTYIVKKIQLANVFNLVERNKEKLKIDQYSISVTTLEEVYLDLVKYQAHPNQESA